LAVTRGVLQEYQQRIVFRTDNANTTEDNINKDEKMSESIVYLWWKGYTNQDNKSCVSKHKIGGSKTLKDLWNSGVDTVVLWTIHVKAKDENGFKKGDLVYNDCVVVSNGKYTGDSGWPAYVKSLKSSDGSISKVLISVGSADNMDFENIGKLGTAPTSLPYDNFQALLKKIPTLDGVVFDYEESFSNNDKKILKKFTVMLKEQGYKQVAFCPFNNMDWWNSILVKINTEFPGFVTDYQLQCYAGGGSNIESFSLNRWCQSVPDKASFIRPGFASKDNPSFGNMTPDEIKKQYQTWKDADITGLRGGFIWRYDDISSPYTLKDYVQAIRTGAEEDSTPQQPAVLGESAIGG
jgi:hypothetical protein